jgi:integrase
MGSLYKRKQKLTDGTVRELPTWWLKYYQNGRAMRESSGTTKETVARRMLRAREGDVEHGIPITPKMGRVTFEEAAKDLLNDYTVNGKKTHDHAKRRLELHLEPHFRGRRLANITTSDIREFVAARQLAGAANGEINRELSALKRMYTLAVQAGKLHGKPYIPMLQEDNIRRGFFEREQFESMRRALPGPLQPVVTFAYLTGWRVISEILPLEWRQVDWDGRVVRLDPGTTKNRAGRTFPFTLDLEQLLKQQLAEHETMKKEDPPRIVRRVFHRDGEPIKDFRGAFASACDSAGCPGRILHDFRRTAVRNLERDGVSRSAAMAMVGHKTESIYRRYAIVDAGALRDAAAKIDRASGTISGTAMNAAEKTAEAQTA